MGCRKIVDVPSATPTAATAAAGVDREDNRPLGARVDPAGAAAAVTASCVADVHARLGLEPPVASAACITPAAGPRMIIRTHELLSSSARGGSSRIHFAL